jgi:hypothetical protein
MTDLQSTCDAWKLQEMNALFLSMSVFADHWPAGASGHLGAANLTRYPARIARKSPGVRPLPRHVYNLKESD